MGLLFKETIFLKDSCDLENEIFELETLKDRTQNKEQITKYIKLLRAGLNGEKAIEYELKNARIGMYVLHDINIQYNDLSAQIDYVIITPAHCYLVECKNMVGDISVDNRGQFVRKLPWGRNEAIYSPLTQAQRHVDIMKKIRDANHGIIGKTMIHFMNDNYFQPLVVVSNSNGILNTKWAKKEIKEKIVRVDALIDYLNRDIKEANLISLDSKTEMEKEANYILSLNVPKENSNWSSRLGCSEETQSMIKSYDQLKEKLLEYRKLQSKERNYPAYYIFTNEQLEKLLVMRPKTIDDLKAILEPIKIKIYGDDILSMINK
ncbi:MAG: NERD domain-containing protein [Erysipelotrichaceae bacterium]|nr:NERD domain-containing protein [Erysipelotrichaceae bacterium]